MTSCSTWSPARSRARPGFGARRVVRARVPVSLHRGEGDAVANRGSFFVVSLPVDEPDPVERLRRISAQTGVCKAAGDARVVDTLIGDLRRVAPPLRRAVERVANNPRAVALDVSNIAGPVKRPTVLGAPVGALYSIAEVAERHGLRVAAVSMADQLQLGFCADCAIVPDLDPLVRGIRAEARALLERSAALEATIASP
jgi:diacylglycerol O-acyltransferase